MKKWKQLTAFALAAATVISLLPSAPAQAATKKKYSWEWTKSTYYSYKDGKWEESSSNKYTYNKKGQLTSSSYTTNHDWVNDEYVNVKTTTESKYKYNSKGNTSTVTHYKNNKKTGKYVYSYNKKGYVTKMKSYDAKNKLVSTATYKLNSKGDWTKCTTTYSQKGKKKEVDTAKYTYKKNQIIKESYTYSDGRKSIEEYTDKGILKKWTRIDGDFTDVWTYDSKGNIKKRTTDSKYSSSVTDYTYKNGRLDKEVDKTSYKNINKTTTDTYTHEYKTDKNKNVTEDIRYLDGTPWSKYVYSGYKKIPVSSK